MNQVLESPLEALAFNYVSFGIFTVIHNLWTWIAVLTAAVSFWRIRAVVGASVQSNDQKLSVSISDRAHDESRPILGVDEKPTPSASVSTPPAPPASVSETSGSQLVTKGGKIKLTVYYVDDDVDVDGGMTVTEWSDGGEGRCCGEWWESWERVLRLRKGEAGWYRYQDLTALNGNVVRLWDESCRRW
ncbi:hypothetical protein E1A91_A06G086000v1 [Gossypium mustelinum]|uniref:Uncharacterized protein n=1 Tax=Gossypium mustelinum TaxID=34275 RepID=A0A5D2YV13_GOSMU|nr:hypothetical protein E1A91_A06G086000v1 [Gossypium mustelinum]